MDISTVLNVKNIKLNMTARTKEEVIEELTDLLVQDGAVTNKEDFIRDVWLREEQGSTGFENHIAIPHGKSSGVSRTALAIGRTQHTIPWETMDGSDVRCIILFAVCLVDQNATHIRLLAQVSGSLADEDIIAKLLAESDPHKIIALFNSETESTDA
ncbi:PTS system fructose-specific EIIABC component [Klebsiella variicola subsp. tropica]|uniref:PTS sugar transporter subunit IIA n=1 Tax=Klebsiella TaxID=570 RepID=UPI000C28D589|nr:MULTISPECIES: PTS sugar transporter subunit IIA [Klebsiella]PJR57323.1 PTS fructose transporter subunit IIA [Klebsiella sp. I-Nf8]PJR66760.1 PTS fructose transporter subunit IIA [Klebsiella sp. K-Nf6]PJX71796.1 PTS fructose transporter subunit IIA [Klebsiella sp. G-Nf4]PJX74660.1 PTS fructose transporter subunit IIA [Klebsiella sp. G2-16S-Nf13]PKJ76944.1 PTS fructose transporter subunit IIA [Klebsiella sp. J-Nf11]